MATLADLQAQQAANLQSAARLRAERDDVRAARDSGAITGAKADILLKSIKAKIAQLRIALDGILEAINSVGDSNTEQARANLESDRAVEDGNKAATGEFGAEATAVLASGFYDEADALFNRLILGQASTTEFEIRIDEINVELIALDFLPWKPPRPPTPPAEEPAAEGLSIDLSKLEALFGQQGNLADLVADSEIAQQIQTLIEESLTSSGFSDELIDQARRSPIDPAKASETAKALTLSIIGAVTLAGSAVIAGEALMMGQLETPASILNLIIGVSGLDSLSQDLAMIPFTTGIIRGTERHWHSINQAEIPGPGDLTKFLVRETISRDRFDGIMREQGFSQEWTDAFWTSHWREISRRDVQDAFHRGVIDVVERDKLLVILDFRPDNRPGISKSDLEIIGSISKRLIPRVDLRRAFKLGLLDFDALVTSYTDLGYEDDAEKMAFIQSNTAFEAAQNAGIREAGKLFQGGFISENDFRGAYNEIRQTFDDFSLWLIRYSLGKKLAIAKAGGGDAPGEELVEEATEINEQSDSGTSPV